MTARVLKKQDIVIDGSAVVGVGAGSSVGGIATAVAAPKSPAAKASAKIVEKTADYLVLQITCSCGTVSHIKCQYSKNENTNTEN